MIPYTQTILEGQNGMRGNCWQTAIASVLDLQVEEVPHFVQIEAEGGENWATHTAQWLWDRGFGWQTLKKHLMTGEFYLVSGPTVRGTQHVTIWQDGRMVHDPHPSGVGLLKEEYIEVIRPIESIKGE